VPRRPAEPNSGRIIQIIGGLPILRALPGGRKSALLLELGAPVCKRVVAVARIRLLAVCVRSIVEECAGPLEPDCRGTCSKRSQNVRSDESVTHFIESPAHDCVAGLLGIWKWTLICTINALGKAMIEPDKRSRNGKPPPIAGKASSTRRCPMVSPLKHCKTHTLKHINLNKILCCNHMYK
jgi:hypothetical protein